MKVLYSTLIVILLLSNYNLYAQVPEKIIDEVSKKLDKESSDVKDVLETAYGLFKQEPDTVLTLLQDSINVKIKELSTNINNLNEQLLNERDTAFRTGTFTGLFNDIKSYSEKKNKGTITYDSLDTFNVSLIEINISEGVIKDLRITTEDGKIFNNKTFIPIINFHKHLTDRLFRVDDPSYTFEFIKLNDVLKYKYKFKNNFPPNDSYVELTPSKSTKEVGLGANLNAHLDLRVYSDFLGLIESEANGLVQTEIQSKILLNTRASSIRTVNYQFINYIQPSLRFSKFDNDFASVPLDNVIANEDVNDLPIAVIDRDKLYQLSKVELSLEVSAIKSYITKYLYIDIGSINSFSFSDITFPDETEETANLQMHGYKIAIVLPKSKNFGFEIGFSKFWQRVVLETGYDRKKYSELSNNDWLKYFAGKFELYYASPFTGNKTFFRFNVISRRGEHENSFNQIQVGYQFRLAGKQK